MNVEIRNESPADAPAIEAVTISAFRDAPHSGHNEQIIVDALRKAGQLTVLLVAVSDGRVIGHVAISPVSVAARYGRFGFLADPALLFPGAPPEYFQALSFGSSRLRGAVSYHAAFY